MKFYLLTTTFVISCFVTVSHALPINDARAAALFLQKCGYLNENNENTVGTISGLDTLSNAIKDFQRFVGLEETGELDTDTVSMMNAPRCDVKDIIRYSGTARRKRYPHEGSKWRVTHLTYRISKYPTKVKDKNKIDKEMAPAFKVWNDKSPLAFEERKTGRMDIDIRFETREHGDSHPFDGSGKTLAHAFFPQDGGDAHFDEEEKWTINEATGSNLFQIAAHEFDHSLGLSHSDKKQVLTAPYYWVYQSSFKLHKNDNEGFQSLYGKESGIIAGIIPGSRDHRPEDEIPVGLPPDTSDAPDLCQDAKIDAATRTQNGNTYVFKGDFYWRILSNKIADGYPRRITEDWDGLEGNLDAAIFWPNRKTYFLKGGRYWRFTNMKMDDEYPKPFSVGFEGIPHHVDAAVIWSGNGKAYFFKGAQYWKYDENIKPPVSHTYPLPISNWNGLPNNLDAALLWNNETYFFKDDKYYKYNDESSKVDSSRDPPYPRSTSYWWFGCKPISSRAYPREE